MKAEAAHVSVVRFIVSGASAALLNLCLLWLFTRQFGLWYLVAAALSYAFSVCYNFVLQRTWTFNGTDGSVKRQVLQFALTNLFGLALNSALLFMLVSSFGFSLFVSQVFVSLVVAAFSYFVYRKIFVSAACGYTRAAAST